MGKSNLVQKVRDHGWEHIVVSTGLLAEVTPIFAFIEKTLTGFSDEVSRNTRLSGAVTAYLGLAFAYEKGRQLSRRLTKVRSNSKEWIQGVHDFIYTGAFNAIVAPPLYYIGGERDLKKILIGSGVLALVGAVNGPFAGYAADLYKDLMGIKDCDRPSYPDFLKNMNPKAKKGLAVAITGGAVIATEGIYQIFN